MEGNDSLELSRWTEGGYLMNNGILSHWDPYQECEEPQLAIPESLREEIVKQFHDALMAGHYEVE